jgi:hypothetical protein
MDLGKPVLRGKINRTDLSRRAAGYWTRDGLGKKKKKKKKTRLGSFSLPKRSVILTLGVSILPPWGYRPDIGKKPRYFVVVEAFSVPLKRSASQEKKAWNVGKARGGND